MQGVKQPSRIQGVGRWSFIGQGHGGAQGYIPK